MSLKIELDLPKFGIAERTKDGLLVRLGPPGNPDQWRLGLNLLALAVTVPWFWINLSVFFAMCPLVLFARAFYGKYYWPSVGQTIEITGSELIITEQSLTTRIPVESVNALQSLGFSTSFFPVTLFNKAGSTIKKLPFPWFNTSMYWLTLVGLPGKVEIMPVPIRNPEASRRQLPWAVLSLILGCTLAIGLPYAINNELTANLQPEARRYLIAALPTIAVLCLPLIGYGLLGIYGVFAKTPKNIKDERLRLEDSFPFAKDLTRAALGFKSEPQEKTYKSELPKRFEDQKKVFNSLWAECTAASLFVALMVLGPLSQQLFYPSHPSSKNYTNLVQGLCTTLLFPVLAVAYRRHAQQLKQGFASKAITVSLSDPPTIDGQPIERISLSLNPIYSYSANYRPAFPHTITAGGKTYRVNFRYFKPVDQQATETPATPNA